MKRRWWIPGILVALGILLLYLYPVRLRLAPRLSVSRALGRALEQLEERFEDSPVHLLSVALDQSGRQKAHMMLQTEMKHLGPVLVDMSLDTQLVPKRILGTGGVVYGGKRLDASLYLDRDFAALASESLLDGRYFGVCYDTFSKDIRNREILAALIGEKTIVQWEKSISGLDTAMSREWKLPSFEAEDIVSALYGILAMKPEVSRIRASAGDGTYADAVTFRATVQEIISMAEAHREEIPTEIMDWLEAVNEDPEASLRVEFLLRKGNLVQIRAELNSEQDYTCVTAVLGNEPETNQLALELLSRKGEDNRLSYVEIRTESDGKVYREQIHVNQIHNRETSDVLLQYNIHLNTGEMDLSILRDSQKAELRLNLTGEEDGVTLRSQNIRPVLNLLLNQDNSNPVICTMTIAPGREVAVPEYRNLDQWSMEDLLTLLAGFGDLMGLKLP